MIWNMMNLRGIKQILTSLGEVSEWLGKWEEKGVRHASLDLEQQKRWSKKCDLNKYDTWKYDLDHITWFSNHKTTYPAYYLAFFSSFCLGALELANPSFQPFLFLFSYLHLHLFHPGAQIKLLITLASLPIYKSAKIKLFGQKMILYILQQEIETWGGQD